MKKGFTLIELLVVISIIGILMAISIFGLQGARESSRDARRKSDLEQIRSALEIYKSDCDNYPDSVVSGAALVGNDAGSETCSPSNTYLSIVPADPIAAQSYAYSLISGGRYEICASLEQGEGSVTCSGSCGDEVTCNYKVENP